MPTPPPASFAPAPNPAPATTPAIEVAYGAEVRIAPVFHAWGTEDSVRGAIAAAKDLGRGGKIVISPYESLTKLAPDLIQLSRPLISNKDLFAHGLIIEFEDTPSWVELSSQYTKGRGFKGDGTPGLTPGTFNCFEWNPDDATGTAGPNGTSIPYADSLAMHNDSLRGLTLNNMVLRSFNYGYKFGAMNKVGVHSLTMHKVICEDCDISGWMENCMQSSIGEIKSSCPKSGGIAIYGSMGAGVVNGQGGGLWHFGNGVIEDIYHQGGGRMSNERTWGIDWGARGLSSEFNHVTILRMQANGLTNPQPRYMQASGPIVTGGSPDIIVTSNIDKFKVDGVVHFPSASGAGLDANSTFWIISKTANPDGSGTIRIGDRRRAAVAVTPTGSVSTAMYLLHCALIMMGGWGEGGGVNSVTFSQAPFIDCENHSGIGIALQGLNGSYVETSIISGIAEGLDVAVYASGQRNHVCMRSPINRLYCNTDYWQFSGYQPHSYHGGTGGLLRTQGLLTDQPNGVSYGATRLFLTGDRRDLVNMRRGDGDIYPASPSAFPAVAFGRPTQRFHGTVAAGGTVAFNTGGIATYTGAAGGTVTLPVIIPVITVTNSQGRVITTQDMRGLELEVMNPTGGAITLASQNTQGFNAAGGPTTFSVPANTLAQLRACSTDGTTFFWAAK